MLKYLFLVFCALLITSDVNAQDFAISPLKMNLFYIGIPNPIKVVVKDVEAKDIVLEISNGEIESTEERNTFLVYSQKVGKTLIIILSKDGDTIGLEEFRVRPLPKASAKVAGKYDGLVRKNVLRAQIGIIADIRFFEFSPRSIVNEYSLIVMRGSRTIHSKHYIDGPKFSNEVKEVFDNLQKGDKVIFCFVKYTTVTKKILRAYPAELIITE